LPVNEIQMMSYRPEPETYMSG